MRLLRTSGNGRLKTFERNFAGQQCKVNYTIKALKEAVLQTFSFNKITLLIPILIIFVPTAFLLFFFSLNADGEVRIILGAITVMFIFVVILPSIYRAYFRRITISRESIKFRTPFRSFEIPWEQVKSFGGFVQSQFMGHPLDEESLEGFSIWGAKFVYVSTISYPQLKNSKIDDTYICFHYRRIPFELIKEYLASHGVKYHV